MKSIKRFVSVFIRLTVVDGLILVAKWLENMLFETRKILSTFALHDTSKDEVSTEKFVTSKSLEAKLEELTDDICNLQTEQHKHDTLRFDGIKKELDALISDYYVEEEEEVTGEVSPITEYLDAKTLVSNS